MIKRILLFFLFCGFSVSLSYAQTLSDSTINLNPIQIKNYYPRLFKASAAFNRIDSSTLEIQGGRSALRSFNFQPGVQMEERSPGSYRLSIRGSLLRSPFGVRNVKIYLADYPFTDASGNTYLNLIDPLFIQEAIVLKGPQASHLGANTGGSILINPGSRQTNNEFGLEVGSFGELHEHLRLNVHKKYWKSNFFQSWQQADGYRENSAMKRLFLQWNADWQYKPASTLKIFTFLSHLNYETPGGLTQSQMNLNRRMARPATLTLPGAVEQRAGIENNSFFIGLNHIWSISPQLSWNISTSTLFTDFSNPFITNYETRKERNWNWRTYFADSRDFGRVNQQLYLGFEWASAYADILNTENLGGVRGKTLAADKLGVKASFGFLRGVWDLDEKLNLEAAISINWHQTQFNERYNQQPSASMPTAVNLKPIWAPKLAISYLFVPNQVLFASLNKGFSSPSLAEIRPSNMQVNFNLQAEHAWNREVGYRYTSADASKVLTLNFYSLNLNAAIVRRLDNLEQEYFVNAGSVSQKGVEFSLRLPLWKNKSAGFLKSVIWEGNYQYQHYIFKEYQILSESFNGNKLTGSPGHKWNQQLQFNFAAHVSLDLLGYFQSEVPLNDGNTVFAPAYQVFDMKMNWETKISKQLKWKVYAGFNNLFNAEYSLGPDLNAVGSRFFNPAPLRNFYAGFKLIY